MQNRMTKIDYINDRQIPSKNLLVFINKRENSKLIKIYPSCNILKYFNPFDNRKNIDINPNSSKCDYPYMIISSNTKLKLKSDYYRSFIFDDQNICCCSDKFETSSKIYNEIIEYLKTYILKYDL